MKLHEEHVDAARVEVLQLIGKSAEDVDAAMAAAAETCSDIGDSLEDWWPNSMGRHMALMVRGASMLRAGNVETARTCFEKAVLDQPLDVEANFNMGLFFEVLHRPDVMAMWMERALRIQPGHYMAQVLLGKYKEREGQYGEALQIYRKAMNYDSDPHLARGQIEQLIGDHKVSLDPVSAWPIAASEILAESWLWRHAFPEWQENFLHPQLDLPKTSLLSDGICVWDDVVGEPLLTMLDDCVDDMFQFVFTNFWLSPGNNVTTSWFSWNKLELESAPEFAIRLLIRRLLCEDPADFCGVEWWARMRPENRGQGLHYDQSEADDPHLHCTVCGAEQCTEWLHGNPWRPRWSSVLFLSDAGGPTVMVEQVHTSQDRNDPRCPQRGFVVMPKRGRWVVFRGDLFHGCMPLEHVGVSPRKIIVFNMWRTHRPPPNHCNPIVYERHPALKHLILSDLQRKTLDSAEALRMQHGIGCCPVPRERFDTAEEMQHSTNFGYVNFMLPTPTKARLRSGTGFYELDWRTAAEHVAARDGISIANIRPPPDVPSSPSVDYHPKSLQKSWADAPQSCTCEVVDWRSEVMDCTFEVVD